MIGGELLALGLLAFLLTYWLHSTVLLSAAWLVTRRLPVGAAGLREGLWRVALFGGFITAGVQTGLGLEPPLGRWVLQPQAAQQVHTSSAALGIHDVLGTGVAGPSAALPTLGAPLAPRTLPQIASRPAGRVRAGRSTLIHRTQPARPAPVLLGLFEGLEGIGTAPASAWSSWVAGGWSVGAFLVVAGLLVCRGRLRRGLAGKRELTEGPLAAALERLHARTSLRPAPRLFVAPRITVPLCTGVVRTAICVPPRALSELTSAEQEAMLAHELGHLVRRDPIWICLTWVAQNVFFFQPLNRVARRELLATAELRADDWAALNIGQRLSLASCLTRIAGWLVGDPPALLAPQMTRGSRAGRSHLGVRVERLLDEQEPVPEPRRRWLAPLAAICLASLALGVPGFAAVGPQQAPPVEPAPEPAPEPVRTPTPEPVPTPEPELETAVEPAPWRATSTVDAELARELEQLDQEVWALESELAELRVTLEGRDLEPSIRRAVSELERRTRELADRRGRVNSVIWEATPPGIRP